MKQIEAQNCWYRYCLLSGLAVSALFPQVPAAAQIVEDGTVGSVVQAPSVDQFEITGGTASGSNLFHSFDEFSIPVAGSATFLNDNAAIETVFGRVTGSGLSSIDGTIGVGGAATGFDLYLINPNGIVFGPGAFLNIDGSFFATTASGVQFGSQGRFHSVAAENESPSLLTIAPSAMFFEALGNVQPRDAIQVLGGVLSVPAEESLTLLAGTANPDGMSTGGLLVDGAVLDAQSGRIVLGAVGAAGNVGIANDNRLNFDGGLVLSDILLQNSNVDVSDFFGGPGGGRSQISGKDITLKSTSVLAENYSGLSGGGGIEIFAENLTLDDSAVQAISYSPVAGGDILLDLASDAGTLSLLNSSVVSAETIVAGAGGDVTVRAGIVELASGSGLGTETQGSGNAGLLSLQSGTLQLDDAFISANTFGPGRGGQIEIEVDGAVELLNASSVRAQADDYNPYTDSLTDGVGNAGDVLLNAQRLDMQSGSDVSTSTLGSSGAGGDIDIRVQDITLNGLRTGLFSRVGFGSPSDGGSINVDTQRLQIENGAQISASTLFSGGSAGDISVRNADLIEIVGDLSATGLFAQVGDFSMAASGAPGTGGSILVESGRLTMNGVGARISTSTADAGAGGILDIKAGQLSLWNGAQVQAATEGFAPGGSVNVSAGLIDLSGVDELSRVPSALVTSTKGLALAGDINVDAQVLTVDAGARISASSAGAGAGGTVRVATAERVQLLGAGEGVGGFASGLYVEATDTGRAGDVFVETPLLVLEQGQILASTVSDDGGNIALDVSGALVMGDRAQISATAGAGSGAGDGGNIDIDTAFVIGRAGEDSDIVANAFLGDGGNIQISAQSLFGIEPRAAVAGNGTNDIDASSEYGEDGVVAIARPELEESLEGVLPNEALDASGWVAQSCGAEDGMAANQFVVTGRGGLALTPETIPSAADTFMDLGQTALSKGAVAERSVSAIPEPEVEAASMASAPGLVESRGWHFNEGGEVVLVAPTAYQGVDPACTVS